MCKLEIPSHYDETKADKIYRVDYQLVFENALEYRKRHRIKPSSMDKERVCLVLVDVQNTFCIPGFELFVAGRSGQGAVEDNKRLCRFIYQNLDRITDIIPTMDTHHIMQIFHPIFFVDSEGRHPKPNTVITIRDIRGKKYVLNPEIVKSLGYADYEKVQDYILYYVESLKKSSKYELIIWPFHAMLGGIGHCLVPFVEEAVFFHNTVRYSQSRFEVKGSEPLSENYSIFNPEVLADIDKHPVKPDNELLNRLIHYDRIILAGQAKSHCMAWTLGDLEEYIRHRDKSMAEKVYVLEDCTSPVVIPGIADFTDISDRRFEELKESGFNITSSRNLTENWEPLKGGV